MKIVGLDNVIEELNKIVDNRDSYCKGGAKVPHLVMNLPQKNGQSFVAGCITSVLEDYKLRKFCGLDKLLEYRLDGSLKGIKRVFEDISGNAVYTNEYEGVVIIDICALSEHVNEYQVDYFIENISVVAQTATVIIYYDNSYGKKMELVKNRVCQALGNYIDIDIKPYSFVDFSEIVVNNIKERGFEIDSEDELITLLCDIVKDKNVSNVKEVLKIAEKLTFCANYDESNPLIETNKVREFYYGKDDDYSRGISA